MLSSIHRAMFTSVPFLGRCFLLEAIVLSILETVESSMNRIRKQRYYMLMVQDIYSFVNLHYHFGNEISLCPFYSYVGVMINGR